MQGMAHKPREDFKAAVGATWNQRGVDEYFLTGDKLRYFFSRVPDEVLAKGRT
jgi:hypothetical protein